jgi:hypothetical protein
MTSIRAMQVADVSGSAAASGCWLFLNGGRMRRACFLGRRQAQRSVFGLGERVLTSLLSRQCGNHQLPAISGR